MKQIYDEDPSYWPHGLDINGFDGGAYLVRQASTGRPVGFVGWQERNEDFKKVGSYAVGILPEFRGNGMAKKAISNLLREKSAGVDKVKACVCPHNKPSLSLAEALGVPVQTDF
jgi:RimJ/RimL family protein N-acetyltransferase